MRSPSATAGMLVVVAATATAAAAVLLSAARAPAVATENRPRTSLTLEAMSSGPVAQVVPDRLVVTRTKNNLNNAAAPPYSKTVADRSSVARLYADIFALPPFPAGAMNCPNDVGITYHLDFYSEAAALLAADYRPTGCASVRLSDGTVKSDPSGHFAADLKQALGMASDRQFLGLR